MQKGDMANTPRGCQSDEAGGEDASMPSMNVREAKKDCGIQRLIISKYLKSDAAVKFEPRWLSTWSILRCIKPFGAETKIDGKGGNRTNGDSGKESTPLIQETQSRWNNYAMVGVFVAWSTVSEMIWRGAVIISWRTSWRLGVLNGVRERRRAMVRIKICTFVFDTVSIKDGD